MIEALKTMLKRHEKFVPYVYDDATGLPITKGSLVIGYPTIGIGRRCDKGNGISEPEAMFLLDNDVARVIAECRSAFPWFDGLDPVRQAVVADMVFNLGLQGFKGFKKMIAAIEAGDYEEAAKEMVDSRWVIQVGQRATELAYTMKEGKFRDG